MAFKTRGYLKETRRPIYSAALILPFLIIYHVGTLILNTTYINGADAVIIRILSLFTVHSMFGSAIVLAVCFAVWQLRTRASWKIKWNMLLLYFLESVCFALVLMFFFGWLTTHLSLSLAETNSNSANLVLYCGAGIYEELVFRAFLLWILIAVFKKIFPNRTVAAIAAAAVTGSLFFAAFHYIGASGDAFSIGSFTQRAIGGLYFSILFVTRGFGVTAAAHAIYDIFIGVILA